MVCWVLPGSEEGVLAEDDAVACREAENDGMDGDEGGCKESWTAVSEFEVDLVTCSLLVSPAWTIVLFWQGYPPPDRGSMQPYSNPTASPHHDIAAPTTHNVKLRPMLPTEEAIAPGVANIPLPTTRDMMMMNALDQCRVRPTTAVSGRTSSSRVRCSGYISDGAMDNELSVDLRRRGVSTSGSERRRGSDSGGVMATAAQGSFR